MEPNVSSVLQSFGIEPSSSLVTPLGNAGGFSGAQLWRVSHGQREYALRRWPSETAEARIRYIHALQEFAGMQLDIVPRLQRTTSSDTLLLYAGGGWELATWLPGTSDFHRAPSPQRLTAALQALARLHIAWEHFPTRMTGNATSPAMTARREQAAAYVVMLPQLRARLALASADLQHRGRRVIDYFAQQAPRLDHGLRAASALSVHLQPCLRDIWRDHVLFTDDKVTGILDFGAARVECVAGDIARLVGSLVGDDQSQWDAALAAYADVRQLSDNERALVPIFDRSSVAMSGMQWLEWLLIDGRQFDMPRVLARLDELLLRIGEPRVTNWTGLR
jgi:Ser/Thr protein kinase RdoA (MazF antagonist)